MPADTASEATAIQSAPIASATSLTQLENFKVATEFKLSAEELSNLALAGA
ncbi:hypothetical protein ACQ9Y2_10120 [Pseudomonas palleroniana]